jgi:hypothetical protein
MTTSTIPHPRTPDIASIEQVLDATESTKRRATDQFFYEIYELCMRHPLVPMSKKKRVMEWAADLGSESWPVTGITMAALELFARQGTLSGVQRGHAGKFGRRDRARRVLENAMTKDELLRDFRESDKTVLITVHEQRGEWSQVIPINDADLFKGDGTVRVTSRNIAWARATLEQVGRDRRP